MKLVYKCLFCIVLFLCTPLITAIAQEPITIEAHHQSIYNEYSFYNLFYI